MKLFSRVKQTAVNEISATDKEYLDENHSAKLFLFVLAVSKSMKLNSRLYKSSQYPILPGCLSKRSRRGRVVFSFETSTKITAVVILISLGK